MHQAEYSMLTTLHLGISQWLFATWSLTLQTFKQVIEKYNLIGAAMWTIHTLMTQLIIFKFFKIL